MKQTTDLYKKKMMAKLLLLQNRSAKLIRVLLLSFRGEKIPILEQN